MEFLIEYAGFLLRFVTIAILVGLIVAGITGGRDKPKKGKLSIQKLNDAYDEVKDHLLESTMEKKAYKQLQKDNKKAEKVAAKTAKNEKNPTVNKVFVIDFDGDIRASAVASMRKEITAILSIATADDEVVVRLESGGGVVHGYGLAASQLERIKAAGIPLTVCVDKVAASGGYMMACVADKILAAPFAILGSIGVVAQVPNLHRLLDKNLVDIELHTAGKYKRTLTMLGKNTDEGREKFKQDLEDTHVLFKTFVNAQRPALDIESIATGDVWYGSQAKDKQLVDDVMTSDAYLVSRFDEADVFSVSYKEPKKMAEKLGLSALSAVETKVTKWFSHLIQTRGF